MAAKSKEVPTLDNETLTSLVTCLRNVVTSAQCEEERQEAGRCLGDFGLAALSSNVVKVPLIFWLSQRFVFYLFLFPFSAYIFFNSRLPQKWIWTVQHHSQPLERSTYRRKVRIPQLMLYLDLDTIGWPWHSFSIELVAAANHVIKSVLATSEGDGMLKALKESESKKDTSLAIYLEPFKSKKPVRGTKHFFYWRAFVR